jgi:hypothetical protein
MFLKHDDDDDEFQHDMREKGVSKSSSITHIHKHAEIFLTFEIRAPKQTNHSHVLY